MDRFGWASGLSFHYTLLFVEKEEVEAQPPAAQFMFQKMTTTSFEPN
jgi:hypothetical protein